MVIEDLINRLPIPVQVIPDYLTQSISPTHQQDMSSVYPAILEMVSKQIHQSLNRDQSLLPHD